MVMFSIALALGVFVGNLFTYRKIFSANWRDTVLFAGFAGVLAGAMHYMIMWLILG